MIAEPVSTCVHEILDAVAAAVAALGHEIIDAALAFGVARIPVLHGRVFDLGIVERDQLDHRRVQLVLVALRRRAAFEIGDVGALVGDDQRALELAGVALVDAEIGRELHRAAHALRHVDERAVGEHRRVQRREEIVGRAARPCRDISSPAPDARAPPREIEQKMTPAFASSSLKVVTTETRIEHRVDRDAAGLCRVVGLADRPRPPCARRPGSPAPSAGCRASHSLQQSPDRPRRAIRARMLFGAA